MRVLLFLLPAVLLAQHPAPRTHATNPPARRSTSAAPAKAATPALTTDDEKTVYALGLSIYQSLSQFDLSPAELDVVKRALTDAAHGKPAEQLQAWGVSEIAETLGAMNHGIQMRLEALGFELLPAAQRCPHLFGARLPKGYSGDLIGTLRANNVFVSQRGSSIRFAPHLHVTEDDIDQLFGALAKAGLA